MSVPDFDLGKEALANSHQPSSPTQAKTVENTESNARRPSISASSTSSRSASFSLPDKPHPVKPGQSSSPGPVHSDLGQTVHEPVGATYANTSGNAAGSVSGSEVFADSDEENLDEEQKAHKRDFNKKRAMHYGNEAALALKKAKEMKDEDEDEEPAVNGVNGSA